MSGVTCGTCTHSHTSGGFLLLGILFKGHLFAVVVNLGRFAFFGIVIRSSGGGTLGIIIAALTAASAAAALGGFAFGSTAAVILIVDATEVEFGDFFVLATTIGGGYEPELRVGWVGGTGAAFDETACGGFAVEFELVDKRRKNITEELEHVRANGAGSIEIWSAHHAQLS